MQNRRWLAATAVAASWSRRHPLRAGLRITLAPSLARCSASNLSRSGNSNEGAIRVRSGAGAEQSPRLRAGRQHSCGASYHGLGVRSRRRRVNALRSRERAVRLIATRKKRLKQNNAAGGVLVIIEIQHRSIVKGCAMRFGPRRSAVGGATEFLDRPNRRA